MKQTLTPLVVALLVVANAWAQDGQTNTQDSQVTSPATEAPRVQTVPQATVSATTDDFGVLSLSAQDLANTPSATGTITDALRSASFVQIDATSRSGAQGGEITPPAISIRGSRPYENNFTINGIANNNLINAGAWDSTTAFGTIPTGDAQSLLLQTDLLSSLTVYSENISAQYGDFTGGVVSAQVRDAATDRWHAKVWFEHTRDSWAHQYFVPSQEDNDTPTVTDGLQKEFARYTSGVTLDGPLMDGRLGALVSYQQSYSRIPVYSAYGTQTEKHVGERRLDNLLIKLNTDANEPFYVAGQVLYTPYRATLYAPVNKNGQYDLLGGGWNFTLNTRADLKVGRLQTDVGYSTQTVSRDAGSNASYQWLSMPDGKTPSKYANWSTGKYANEGLLGDYDQDQQTLNLKSVLDLQTVTVGKTSHSFKTGVDVAYTRAHSESEGYTSYSSAKASSTVTGQIADGVVANEQYLSTKIVAPQYDRSVDYTTAAFFIEDNLNYERLNLRPGLRLSYDSITGDVNWAPRLAGTVDVLNDGRYEINFGANRYYGSQVLTNALMASVSSLRYTRSETDGALSDWSTSSQSSATYRDFGQLDSPYTNELVLGAGMHLPSQGFIHLEAVTRQYKDQLRLQSVTNRPGYNYEMNNSGQSAYRGITLTYEQNLNLGRWGQHHGHVGITYSKLTGNSTNWLNSWSESVGNIVVDPDWIYLDGVRQLRSDLPANNFNSDWVLTYQHDASFWDDRLRLNLLLRWESPADRLVQGTNIKGEDGKTYQSYTRVANQALFNADFQVGYDFFKWGQTTMTLNAQVLNVFDNRNFINVSTSSTSSGTYAMGRQFFLGMAVTY